MCIPRSFRECSSHIRVFEDETIALMFEAPAPKNQLQLKSLLGMVQYYHRHLSDLADKFEPLHRLLRKKIELVWGKEQEETFSVVRKILTAPEVLVHYDPTLPILVHCDAYPYGLGAVYPIC